MTEQKSKYDSTLNLPQTAFPMKAELAKREPEMLKQWESEGLYGKIRAKSAKAKEKYILHDGPPYANGNTHIGHALNKILKDIIVKYKTMRGYDSLYVPGWDCHGLPIEHACLKEMGKRKEQVERVPFRKEARKYAERFVGMQKEEFKRLGVFGEWDKPYLTMNYGYQASIAESFLRIYEKGFIEQRLKPVPWCWDCETALADAELEYEDKVDETVYVQFPFKDGYSFLVWTTTPWTLPANVGLAFNPDLEYAFAETSKGKFIFAEALLGTLQSKLGLENIHITKKVKGEEFKGSEAEHPFLGRKSACIEADYVSATDGTGIVHIAPGHGEDDYKYGYLENKLPILSPVNHWGKFTADFKEGEGLKVLSTGNLKVIEILQRENKLVHQEKYSHSYPHCWRCKKPIIFRATPQWFMKIEHENLRGRMSKAIAGEIKFTPDWGKNRIGSMVEGRPDWCVSRQRYWGVPIPVVRCENCKKVFVSETKDTIVKTFNEQGADVWFEKEAKEFFPGGNVPKCCDSQALKKEDDILDVWFDSGVSHQAVLKGDRKNELKFPADLYLEGSDQHRGWFQSSLTASMALENVPPFKGVLTHGFVVDGSGKKMSKSLGNVVAPQDVMKEFGADILRLWCSSVDYSVDVRLSKDILKQLADSYRKIRNTFRYILSNLYDFDPKTDSYAFDNLNPLDQWAMSEVDMLAIEIEKNYETFTFHEIYQKVYNFCTVQLSSYYFDILKDILYTGRKDGDLRRSAQTVLYYILKNLAKMLAPIMPMTTDEVWRSFPMEEGVTSIHESTWKLKTGNWKGYQDWNLIKEVRNAITPALEKKRAAGVIGASLDAKIVLKTEDPELARILKAYWNELPRVLIVSQVVWMEKEPADAETVACVTSSEEYPKKITVYVEKADGLKCVRCWNYSEIVGTDSEHRELCGKCLDAVKG